MRRNAFPIDPGFVAPKTKTAAESPRFNNSATRFGDYLGRDEAGADTQSRAAKR
jgi:hypothetical protein